MDRSDSPSAPAHAGRHAGAAEDLAATRAAAIHAALDTIPEADGYFRARYAAMADPARGRRARALLRYELALAATPVAGADVLDAGCGPGVYATTFAMLGARRVLAIDRFAQHLAALDVVARRFGLPIVSRGDDAARVAEPDASFDLIYCREAISHFADPAGFVRECARLLRPGGAVVVSDGNNGANPWVRRRIHTMWERSERGPFEPEMLHEGIPLPYLFRRWMLIRRELPRLADEEVFRLGMHTATLGGAELVEAIRRYATTGALPPHRYRRGASVRRPEDGQRTEEPLDPRALARAWRACGLDARAHPHFGFGRGGWVRALNRIAAPLAGVTLLAAPAYVVTARRAGRLAGPPPRG